MRTGRILYFASDYFDVMYECAVKLIHKGKAYVCDLTADQIREYRGDSDGARQEQPLQEPLCGRELAALEAMKDGEYEDGSRCSGQRSIWLPPT